MNNYLSLSVPGNAYFIVVIVKNISQFSILQEENVKGWLSDNIFSKAPFLVSILIDQGIFVTSLVAIGFTMLIVILGTKVQAMKNIFLKIKAKLMWSSILRS